MELGLIISDPESCFSMPMASLGGHKKLWNKAKKTSLATQAAFVEPGADHKAGFVSHHGWLYQEEIPFKVTSRAALRGKEIKYATGSPERRGSRWFCLAHRRNDFCDSCAQELALCLVTEGQASSPVWLHPSSVLGPKHGNWNRVICHSLLTEESPAACVSGKAGEGKEVEMGGKVD